VNLLLVRPEELDSEGLAHLNDRRAGHALEVLAAQPGEKLRVGLLGGLLGEAEVLSSDAAARELVLKCSFTDAPPPRPGIDLLLAIPRPKALRKVLPAAASLGVDRIVLLNAARVEKSYFDSKVLVAGYLEELLVLGLEQARDTRVPEILIRQRFRPFVEDELPGMFPSSRKLLAHPGAPPLSRRKGGTDRVLLAVGPEGGWVPFELELMQAHGFEPFSAGERILRVETAVAYLIGMLERT
jgi:RsmE family RNA methyltransferase